MLLVLFNWFYILFTCAGVGLISAFALQHFVPWPDQEFKSERVVLLGMIILTTACNVISLFSPINALVNILITIPILAGLVFFCTKVNPVLQSWIREFKTLKWFTKVALLLVIAIAIFKTIGPSYIDDEGGYHLPLIRWIENYPVVPGIANIEDRMGFNPGIYMTNAFFSMTWLFAGGLYDLNSLLFIVFGYAFLRGLDRLLREPFQLSFANLTGALALIFLFRAYLTSMDADFIYIYGSIYLLTIFLKKIELDSLGKPNFAAFIFFMLFAFIVTNKFIIGLLAPLPVWMLYRWIKTEKWHFISLITTASLIVVVPWMVRNYYISGYLVYPLHFLDFFNVDWKVPLELARGQYDYVSEYARMEITQPFNEYVNHHYSWRVWFPVWWERIWGLLIGKILIITLPIAFLLNIYLFFIKDKHWRRAHSKELILLLFLLLATVIWFWRIPAIRFAWGWLLVFLILSFGLTFKPLLLRYKNWLRYGALVLVLVSLLRGSIAAVAEFPNFTAYLLTPMPVREQAILTEKNLNSIQVKVSETNFCWGIEPPCLPRKYHPGLTPRGDEVTDGFKIIITPNNK